MHYYQIHTLDTAPEQSRPALQALQQAVGAIPNLAATMAGSPALIKGFVAAFANFHSSTFDGKQKQVLLLTNAVTNSCAWAVAFHSTLAIKEGADAADVQAIREGKLPQDPKLAALSALTRRLIETRGHLDDKDLSAFTAAGFAADQVLEVISGLAVSVQANYAGNITKPVLEEAFKPLAWTA